MNPWDSRLPYNGNEKQPFYVVMLKKTISAQWTRAEVREREGRGQENIFPEREYHSATVMEGNGFCRNPPRFYESQESEVKFQNLTRKKCIYGGNNCLLDICPEHQMRIGLCMDRLVSNSLLMFFHRKLLINNPGLFLLHQFPQLPQEEKNILGINRR